jgi:hypothetical protein
LLVRDVEDGLADIDQIIDTELARIRLDRQPGIPLRPWPRLHHATAAAPS